MNSNAATIDASVIAQERSFLGHPRGLAFIVFTEAWERFSFYGMQALLVLYMATYLLHPGAIEQVVGFSVFRAAIEALFGPLSIQALATQIFGLYIGLIYFVPVLGGLIGDRYLGRTRAVLAGAVAMAIGHFLMAFEGAFLFALSALILGSGLLKGNLAAQVGGLYSKEDQRRDSAFSIYCVAINVGAFVAPLVCGTLGELYGWHYGFGAAGIGMLVGIGIYLRGRKYLPPDLATDSGAEKPKLAPGDGKVIFSILVTLGITALFWTAQTQVWNAYPLWIKARVDRTVFDLTVPVTWFQSLDSMTVLVFAPVVLWLWRRQAKQGREPTDLTKIALGCAIFASACLWLGIGEWSSGSGSVHLIWPVVFHAICAWGFLYAGPVALSLVSRGAPLAVNAMMVGSYYLAIFIGGIASGWLGRFYELMSPAAFWVMHGAIVGVGTLLLIVLRHPLLRAMKRENGETPDSV